jgi:hypothetical protein
VMAGFIYLLSNPAMPRYYKIGCTGGSPMDRAAHLSSASGVPAPFKVLLYVRMENFQREEQWLHAKLADFRPRHSREFFLFDRDHLPWLRSVFRNHPRCVEYAECQWPKSAESEHGNPWQIDPDADDGLYLHGPALAPIEPWEGELL